MISNHSELLNMIGMFFTLRSLLLHFYINLLII